MLPKGNFPAKVYLNGEIVTSENATISVFDRGFLFGDGIYEVMVQLENGIFYKKAHLDRLQENLVKIGIEYQVSDLEKEISQAREAGTLTPQSLAELMSRHESRDGGRNVPLGTSFRYCVSMNSSKSTCTAAGRCQLG